MLDAEVERIEDEHEQDRLYQYQQGMHDAFAIIRDKATLAMNHNFLVGRELWAYAQRDIVKTCCDEIAKCDERLSR